jgi:peptidoglycan/LPS O-acetylase OafA/YrhL
MHPQPIHATSHLSHPKYRADIDGLRGIAILAVVGFHAFPTWIKGGFIGVDVFFVISGFLISTIIFGSLSRNAFSFYEFYARRIKRIFPALFIVLLSSLVFGWFALLPEEYKKLGKHIAGGAGFFSNFMLWNESGYFDNAAETKPLLHLWSLGIEEQFYFVWPLALWLAWKKRFNLLTIALVVAMLSFALNVYTVHNDLVAAFYSPLTRLWELMIGSILAYVMLYKHETLATIKQHLDRWLRAITYAHASGQRGDTLRNFQSLLGAMLIALSIVLISKEKQFPGWWALLPTLGAALIIGAGTHAWLNRAVLANRALVWFGLISYPLYLWHWPLLTFTHLVEGTLPHSKMRMAALITSILLAWLTYRFIEKPFRFGGHSRAKTVTLIAMMSIIALFGFNDFRRDGYEFRFTQEIRMYVQTIDFQFPKFIRYGDCHLETDDENIYDATCVESARPLIALWGDSHASALYPGLKKLQKENNFGIMQLTNAACPPLLKIGTYSILRKNCDAKNKHVIDLLIKNEPDVLIMGSAYKVPGSAYLWDDPTLVSKIDETLKFIRLKLPDTKIIVIGPAPQWRESPQKTSYLYWKDTLNKTGNIPILQQAIIFPDLEGSVKKITELNNDTYISAIQHLCKVDKCISRVGDTPESFIAVDYGHLSKAGSEYFMGLIKRDILINLTHKSRPRDFADPKT